MCEQKMPERRAEHIAALAADAVLQAAEISPRPKTPRDGCAPAERTAAVKTLRGYFTRCAHLGCETDDIRRLFLLIRAQDTEMDGEWENERFTLGILCAAVGHTEGHDGILDAREICGVALSMSRMALRDELDAVLADGHPRADQDRLFVEQGIRGIRGEAIDGFPSIQRVALPAFKRYCAKGYDKNAALARAYLHLIAGTEDTAMIQSGGLDAYRETVKAAAALCEADVSDAALTDFYSGMAARGQLADECAALMAGLIFLFNCAVR